MHDDIRKQTGVLAIPPELGRPTRVLGARELVISGTPYIAAYRFAGDVVTELRLLHGARPWPRKL